MKKVLFFIPIAAMLLTACSKTEIPTVETYMYEKQQFSEQVILDGVIFSCDDSIVIETDLINDRVAEVSVKAGDYLKKGDKICTFDTTKLESDIEELRRKIENNKNYKNYELQQYEAKLSYAKETKELEINKKQNEIDKCQEDYDSLVVKRDRMISDIDDLKVRIEELYVLINSNLESEKISLYYEEYEQLDVKLKDLEQGLYEYDNQISEQENQIRALNIELENIRHECEHDIKISQMELDGYVMTQDTGEEIELAKLTKKLEQAVVYSPADGIITSLNVMDGRVCTDGIIAEISSENNMQIKVAVPDEYILSIKEGDELTFSSSAVKGKIYEGVVSKVDMIRGEEGFDVYVDFEKAEEHISGLMSKVTFILNSCNSYAVPLSAVDYDNPNEIMIYTLEKSPNGEYKVKGNISTLGVSNGTYAEVESSEIKEGELVVRNYKNCVEGMIVKPSEMKEQE
jgi:HlyD family secretion protein